MLKSYNSINLKYEAATLKLDKRHFLKSPIITPLRCEVGIIFKTVTSASKSVQYMEGT